MLQGLLGVSPPINFNYFEVMILSYKKTSKTKKNFWPLKAFLITFALAVVFSIFSEFFMREMSLPIAILILIIIILIGIIFDAIGVAVTTCDTTPFVSMASKKVRGSKQSINLLQNASQVSNFCNDIVGDICGIISGAAGVLIIARLTATVDSTIAFFMVIGMSALVAAFTVGGKALGKKAAIVRAKDIVYIVGYVLSIFKKD